MTPEERELLNKVAQTVEENNTILHGIRRSMRLSSVMRWVYWIIIIGASVGAFWLIQPYLNAIGGGTSDTQNSFSNIKEALNSLNQ